MRIAIRLLIVCSPIVLAVITDEVVRFGRSMVLPLTTGLTVCAGASYRWPVPPLRAGRRPATWHPAITHQQLQAMLRAARQPAVVIAAHAPLAAVVGVLATVGDAPLLAIPWVPAVIVLIGSGLYRACVTWGMLLLQV